jgi:hypothetical protein
MLDQERVTSRGPTRSDIAIRVPDHPGRGEIQIQLARCLEQHAGRRLTTIANPSEISHDGVRVMEAELERAEAHPFGPEQLENPRLDLLEDRHRYEAFRRRRLVGDAYEQEPGIAKAPSADRGSR